jgi:FG-GAP-like repeat/FG-GAP repeat
MKRSLTLLISVCSLRLLDGCGGGGGSTTPTPPVATHFSVTQAATTVTAGTGFNFTVAALDASNATVTSYAGTVHFSSSDAQAVLPANSTLANGVGSFAATLKTSGVQTITATDTATSSIASTPSPTTVRAAATSQISATAPANANAGTPFNFSVTAKDPFSNTVSTYSGALHFTSSDAKAILPGNATLTNGTGTFSATLNTAGGQTIRATDTITSSITGSSIFISVSAAAAGNPVPLINQPLSPDALVPGGAFKLTVNGTGFVSGAIVKWNSSPRATSFVSDSQLTATVLASDIAKFNTASVTVVNPAPGGGTSNVVFFETIAPSASVSLSTPSEFAAGSGPISVATGEFNGDGKVDVVVANNAGNTISVFLGNGDGTFQAAVDYAVGANPRSVAVGDFNGDGKLDLVVTNEGSDNVSILLGNGDGTFQIALDYTVGSNPSSAAVGDFNGDGNLDLAITNLASGNVSMLLGNGDGTFQSALDYTVGSRPSSVAVGDLNGDGKLDLVVANPGSGYVSVLLGNGDGTFQAAVNYSTPSPDWVVLADFNGDGKLDLAVATGSCRREGCGGLSVLLGSGDGTFQAAVLYGSGGGSLSMAVGDFNGDGKLDLVVANEASNNVSILLGNGDGTFQSAMEYVTGSAPSSVVVGDFNGDGKLDIAVAELSNGTVFIQLQP